MRWWASAPVYVTAWATWSPFDNVQVKAVVARRIGPDAGMDALSGRRAETRAWTQLVVMV